MYRQVYQAVLPVAAVQRLKTLLLLLLRRRPLLSS
jgi:hypothetical protein